MQVLPAAQAVPPVHPTPPHCPYLGIAGPAGAADVVVGALVLVESVVFTGIDVVGAGAFVDVVSGGGLDEPEPTDVVSEPDST